MSYPVLTRWIARPKISAALGYGLAVVSVAAALAVTLVFLRFDLPLPFTSFALTAIALTFWYSGTKPGIVALLLAMMARSYFFEPRTSTLSRVLYELVFIVFALLMSWVR